MTQEGEQPGKMPDAPDEQDIADLELDEDEGLTERVRGGRRLISPM